MQMNTLVEQVAREWIGTPYLHQASVVGVGCDCIGLVRGVWRTVFGEEPEAFKPYSSAWSEITGEERLMNAAHRNLNIKPNRILQPGNVVLFRMRRNSVSKHIGILGSPKTVIHAYEGNCVVETSLTDFWLKRITGVFEFPAKGKSV